jgi:predicted Zn-dependent protease
MMFSFAPFRAALAALAVIVSASCAQNPVTGKSDFVIVSEDQELRMGRAYDQQVKKESPVYDHKNGNDPGLADYVENLGQKLARQSHRTGLAYRFTVIDSPDVNAFALPGGFVYVTRGILAYLNSEAELAAVMGHEIGHVTARHSVRQISAEQGANVGLTIASIFIPGLRNQAAANLSNIAAGALLSGYGRDHELEADRLGAEYLARTGYPTQAMINVIGVLKNQETFDAQLAREENRAPRAYHGLFASHPDNDARLREVIGEASRVASGGSVVNAGDNRDAFLSKLDGVVFADSATQGVLRGNRFYHAELGLAMQFAADWRVQNLPDRLRAIAPGGEASIEVLLEAPVKGAPQDLLRRRVAVDGDIDTATVNGNPAAIANVRGANVRAGSVFLGTGEHAKAFVLVGQAKTADLLRRHLEAINTTFKSIRAFADADRKDAEPLRIRIIVATAATRYAGLAKASPLGRHAESQLRLLNAQYPAGEPVPGQKLKVVE